MLKKYRYGTANPSSKLDAPMVRAIRESSDKSIVLAERYGVSDACIARIRKRVDWKHVP